MELLQAYSNRGRHYEGRFDKVLAVKHNERPPRKPHRHREKSSAKLVHRLAADQVTEMTGRYRQGWSSRRLAATYAISKTSVVQLLREVGVPIRRQGLAESHAKEIVDRYAAGASLAAIGTAYAVSADTVRKLLIRQGVALRRPWEHPTMLPSPADEQIGSGREPVC